MKRVILNIDDEGYDELIEALSRREREDDKVLFSFDGHTFYGAEYEGTIAYDFSWDSLE